MDVARCFRIGAARLLFSPHLEGGESRSGGYAGPLGVGLLLMLSHGPKAFRAS